MDRLETVVSSPNLEKLGQQAIRILESITDAFYALDRSWRFTYVNARAEQFLQRSRTDLLGKNFWEEFPRVVSTKFDQEYRRAVAENVAVTFEEFYPPRNAWFAIHAAPYEDGLSVYFQDITGRKMTEMERLERDAIVESSQDAILGKTLEGVITSWNSSAERLYGYTREQAVGQHISLIVPLERLQELDGIVDALRRGERIERFETVRVRKDGSRVEVSVTISPIKNSLGEVIGASTIAHNITEQKWAEDRLRESEERFRATFEQAAVGIAHIATDGHWLRVNQRLCDMVGYTREELMQIQFQDITHPDDLETDLNFVQRMLAGELPTYAMEKRYLHKDGSTVWINMTVSLVRDAAGKPDYFISVVEDINERKQLETQFLQAQKMEGIGRLAGGIAHDFNNLLAAIMGYTELAEMDMEEGGEARGHLANVTHAAERAAGLTHQLLAFARKQICEPKIINLNDLVRDLAKLLHRLLGEDVELVTRLQEGLASARIDPSQLAQVLVNLAVNARDAMPRGGKLSITTANIVLDDDFAALHIGVRPGRYVQITVSDNGTGMTDAVKQRLFEPFYTTKGVGKGTGLGLATSYGIIRQHEGHIFVESVLNMGTIFTIYLPCVDAPAIPLPRQRTLSQMPIGTETILVVEDEPLVRGFAVQFLRGLNYRVLEAADGETALHLVEALAAEEKLHLVVTDMIMPRMGGRELIQQLQALRPAIKALYTSGYTDEMIVAHGVLEEGMAFLQKPYTPAVLAHKVRDVLDA